jgi:hypothetical protein
MAEEMKSTTTQSEAVGPATPCSGRLVREERHKKRMEFLRTLDGLTARERCHLLEAESEEEILSLYIVAVNCYGDETAVCKTLLVKVGQWLDRSCPNEKLSEPAGGQT